VVGTYKLRLQQQGGTTGNVPIAAVISGNPLVLDLNLGQPDSNQQTQISAILKDGTTPVTGATVVANIQGIEGYQKVIQLLDDGLNGDGQAGDGVYGGKTESLAGGGYNVGVIAQGANFQRIATDAISIARPNEANLFLRQVKIADSGIVGEDITYTFEVGNLGAQGATQVKLLNTLPQGVDFVSASNGGVFNVTDRTITFNLADLAPTESTTVDIKVKRNATGALISTANVMGAEKDPDLSNNTFRTTGSDLRVKRVASQLTGLLNQPYTYSLVIENLGPDDATDVVLKEKLVSELKFVSSSFPISISGSDLVANLGTLKSGTSQVVDFTVQSVGAGDFLSFTYVDGAGDDYTTANNSLTSTTTFGGVVPAPVDLELKSLSSNLAPKVGDTITLTLTLTNQGPGVASGIKVADLLSPELRFVSASAQQGTYNSQTGIWDADVVGTDSFTNTAEVTALNERDVDSTPNNNNPVEDDQTSLLIQIAGGSSKTLTGTDGRDTLVGGTEDNIIIGQLGSDTLTGGGGRDQFVYTGIRDGRDIITDFTIGEDKIVLSQLFQGLNLNYSSAISGGYLNFVAQGNDSVVIIDPDGSAGSGVRPIALATLKGVSVSALNNTQNFLI
jgi:uncharacterized repeat protein (TIGR01451 family)